MAYGSALPEFKRALIDSLDGFVDDARYSSPMVPEDMIGTTGTRVVCWWDDDAQADLLEPVTIGPTGRIFDEEVRCALIIQALGVDTDDTQEICDQRISAVLGEVVALLSSEPDAGRADTTDVQTFDATPESWTYTGGVLGTNLRAASYRVEILVHSRLTLERT